MSSNKTVETDVSVENFINAVEQEQKRRDSWDLIAMMKEITGAEPRMWGPSLVGFGRYHYKYASGREGDFFITGFSPRKTVLPVPEEPECDRSCCPGGNHPGLRNHHAQPLRMHVGADSSAKVLWFIGAVPGEASASPVLDRAA
jgi:hypothetical protein